MIETPGPSVPTAGPGAAVRLPLLRTVLRLLALGLGAAHTVVAVLQQSMNEDGIDYLDMGDAWLRGDWDMAVNGIWSPLYSWILGAMNHLFEPSIPWQFPAVQITNFFIYAAALVCFEYFWRSLTRNLEVDMPATVGMTGFHPAAWMVLGYSLFIWSSLNLVEIWAVNPDMCVAGLAYLAAGLFLRLSRISASIPTALGLGFVLGLGYLAKAAMMPLAVVLMLLTIAIPSVRPGKLGRLALIAAAFLLIAGPFMVALTSKYGAFTFSDVGRFTFLKHVNEMPYPNFHPALHRLDGVPEHPPTKIFDDPPVYEFSGPVGGTYPMSYDPGYWTAGLEPSVGPAELARSLATQVMAYFELFFRTQGGFLATVLLLLLMTPWETRPPRDRIAGFLVFIWAIAAFGLYSLVHVTTRYIAPFVVLLWAGLLSLVRLPDGRQVRRLMSAASSILILFVWINIAALNLEGLSAMAGFSPLSESGATAGQFSDGHRADHPAIAEELLSRGFRQGDHVAFIGYSFSAYWARLARLRIVAEIHPEDIAAFWTADATRQEAVLRAFAGTGVKAVLSESAPPGAIPPGWEPIGDTGYLMYRFR